MAGQFLSLLGSAFFGEVAFAAKNEVTNQACWRDLKIRDVDIDSSASVTVNPIHTESDAETSTVVELRGEDVSTLKIFNPSRLRISALAESLSDVNEVIAAFFDPRVTLTVSTKGIMASNMAVTNVDVIQSPEGVSIMALIIELEQTLPPTVQSAFNPSQASDASTYGVSIQNPPVTTNTPLALFNKLAFTF